VFKKSESVPEDVDKGFVASIENFLREGLEELGFHLGKRHYHKRGNTFWFWVSKKGFFHFPTVMLNIIDLTNEVKLDFLEYGLPEEGILKCLLENYQEQTGTCITVEAQVSVF